MDRHFIEEAGWGLIAYGLMLIGLTALAALVRSADTPSEPFFWLYVVAFAAIWYGFRLLKYVGAWPPRHTNRP